MTPETVAAQQSTPAWVAKSNQNAQVLLDVRARFSPESAGYYGVSGVDEQIFDLKPNLVERSVAATDQAIIELERRRTSETDAAVRQDLEILIDAAQREKESTLLNHELLLPYFSLHQAVFQGLKTLLDDQIPAERRARAAVRLRRYAGQETGYEPLSKLAQDRIRERLAVTGLLGPVQAEVEKDLANAPTLVAGIRQLLEKYDVKGTEQAMPALVKQLAEYEAFIRAEMLPRARTDFRQPRKLYAQNLKDYGVDMPVDELASRAQVAFREIQNEMQAIALLVARERGLASSDYRDVIRELKKKQLVGVQILPHYEARNLALEKLIREHRVLTLPERKLQIRLATEAESATIPAPHMQPPRLIGNTGERGTFVLPLHIPAAAGEAALTFDDFTNESASWTLSAHEARPGHELQFAAMVEKGVSIARAIFAFNSTNAEGWGLYAEAEMKPYEPLDGQLMALQHRLMRAARAFLDPGLQLGTIPPEEATRVLREEVVLSEAMALQEVERYTFRAPGQATSYFCGYQRLMELRTEVERTLGKNFDRMRFHDFVLAQGLLPPKLLRKAVLEEFVPSQQKSRS
jgi:uncharacterized protein (DUF885 family)